MDNIFYSEFFKALGHPVRLKIVAGLIENEKIGCNVNDIAGNLSLPQSTISQHLGILKRAKIIDHRNIGVSRCYYVCNDLVRDIIKRIEVK